MRRYGLGILLLVCGALPGCGGRRAAVGFHDVQEQVGAEIGKELQWEGAPASANAQEAVEPLLQQKELSIDAAVQIALLKNPSLQAVFEELGIAEADVMEAGVPKNPVLGASVRFPDRGPAGANNELTIAFNFIDLLLIPMRKRIEGLRFDAAKTRVVFAVLNLATDVKRAYYELQGAQARLRVKKDQLLGAEAASEFTQKLLKAGNASELEALPRIAAYQHAKLEAARDELELAGLREKLSRLLGVACARIQEKIPDGLPELPEHDAWGESTALEARAVANRLDLQAQRRDMEIVEQARALRHWGVFTAVELGASTERDPDGVRVTGPTLQMELPVFNRGQADRARLLAQYRQSRDRLAALELEVRSEVREALAKLNAARGALEAYRTEIGPLHARLVELAQERYNNMTLGALDLLAAKQEQLSAQAEQVEALRDYWIHRVELERAVGGRLQSVPAQTPAAATTQPQEPVRPPPPAEHEHQH
ncbi:MAG: TolC family protein [Planctomycetes bacterium]|nr:TolC family protein [Planctomycetota bacterium]